MYLSNCKVACLVESTIYHNVACNDFINSPSVRIPIFTQQQLTRDMMPQIYEKQHTYTHVKGVRRAIEIGKTYKAAAHAHTRGHDDCVYMYMHDYMYMYYT